MVNETKKRSIGLLGADYCSDSEDSDSSSDETETEEKTSSHPHPLPESSASLTTSSLSSSSSVSKRIKFASVDQLTTIILFDPIEPIDPILAKELSDNKLNNDNMVETLLEEITEEETSSFKSEEQPSEITESKNIYLASIPSREIDIPKFENVPAPPPLKRFSFTKNTTTVTKVPLKQPAVTNQTTLLSNPSISHNIEGNTSEDFEFFCDVCNYTIEVGEYRYDCRLCAKDTFTCCDICYSDCDDKKSIHKHNLSRNLTTK